MNAPVDDAAARREAASEPTDLRDLRERLAFIGRIAWQETKATVVVAWAQVQRLAAFGRADWKNRRLARRYLAAQIALGERLDAVSLGDAAHRARLADLRERRRSFVAAKESTRAIDAEYRGLCVRLAEPFLESVQSPASAEQQHRQALALRMEIADRQARQTERRTTLFPDDTATRMRIAAGLGAFLMLFCLITSAFFGDDDVGDVLLPPSIDLENLQPLASFVLPDVPAADATSNSNVETRTLELDADAMLPARTVTVTLVDGKPEGEVRSVDATGKLICIETFRRGLLNGTRQRFYPSGEKFSELRFVDGVAQGEYFIWFPGGLVAARTDVVDGVPHGDSLIRFDNGRKCVSTTYVQGRPHGQRSHYRPDDVCFAIVEWREGQPVSQKFLEIEVTAADVEAIEKRGAFSTRLVDHWVE